MSEQDNKSEFNKGVRIYVESSYFFHYCYYLGIPWHCIWSRNNELASARSNCCNCCNGVCNHYLFGKGQIISCQLPVYRFVFLLLRFPDKPCLKVMLIAYYRLFETFRLLSVASDRRITQPTAKQPSRNSGRLSVFFGYTARKNFTRNSREMA